MALNTFKISSELIQAYKQCPTSMRNVQHKSYDRKHNNFPSKQTSAFKIKLIKTPQNVYVPKHLQPAFMPNVITAAQLNLHEKSPRKLSIQPYNGYFIKPRKEIRKQNKKALSPKISIANSFKLLTRNYSTPIMTGARYYSSLNKEECGRNCGPKTKKPKKVCENKCGPRVCVKCPKPSKPVEEKCAKKCGPKVCKPFSACPCLNLKNCPPRKRKTCDHPYLGPKCQKKFAPYKSFSELCAERLEDDPSECFQCPWSKCRDVNQIRPGKKKYHTLREVNKSYTTSVTKPEEMLEVGNSPITFSKNDLCKPMHFGPAGALIWNQRQSNLNDVWFGMKFNEGLLASNKDSDEFERKKRYLDDCSEKCSCKRCHSRSIFGYNSYEMKRKIECPNKKDDECIKRKPRLIPVQKGINKKYKPFDPCCEEAKKGKRRSKKSKYFVPDENKDCSTKVSLMDDEGHTNQRRLFRNTHVRDEKNVPKVRNKGAKEK